MRRLYSRSFKLQAKGDDHKRWALSLASKTTEGGRLTLLFDMQEAKGGYIAATCISSDSALAFE